MADTMESLLRDRETLREALGLVRGQLEHMTTQWREEQAKAAVLTSQVEGLGKLCWEMNDVVLPLVGLARVVAMYGARGSPCARIPDSVVVLHKNHGVDFGPNPYWRRAELGQLVGCADVTAAQCRRVTEVFGTGLPDDAPLPTENQPST